MILVDIYVPSIDKCYDFQLNEEAKIETVIEEISEMVGQKERSSVVGDVSKLTLCDKRKRLILDGKATLASSGIVTGDSLILV